MRKQLNVTKASQQSAKLALDSEIGGVNTTVTQIEAQLRDPGLNVCVSFEKLLASVKCFTIYRD